LVVLILISVTIISLDEAGRTQHLTSGLKSIGNDIFNPIRSGVNDILNPIGRFFAGAVNYGSLQQENQRLQHEIGALRQSGVEGSFERNQENALAKLHAEQSVAPLSQLRTVMAQEIGVDNSNFASTIEIDKGSSDGVTIGMPVVGSGGLAGQVVRVSNGTATVRLVTDGQSKVGVMFGASTCTTCSATIDGQGAGKPMTASFVAPNTPLTKGEVMYTNGLSGGEFPAGLPVGYVSGFHQVSGASQINVSVEPESDLNQLGYVDVIIWEPPA
jgi:rod shape-determining protein MreC